MNSQSLTSRNETLYFVLSAIVSVIIYLVAIASYIGVAIVFVLLGFVLFSNAMMLGHIRGNGVRVSEKQFPDIYERVVELSEKMAIAKVPDIFIIHSEGAFNAFATRFFGRNMVVIYSEVFELAREQGEKELDFIIAHELAHIKRRHVWKSMLVFPSNFVPFLAQAYSRACEYTCDRKAAYYTEDASAAKRALTILGIGKGLYKEIDDITYLEQIHSESNVAVWFAKISSTHPILPKRIQAVGQFMKVEGASDFQTNTKKIAIGAIVFDVSISALYGGVVILFVLGLNFLSPYFPSDDVYADEEIVETTETPLMLAAVNGDIKEVETLIRGGVNIHEKDEESSTALHYAVYYDEIEVVELLLENDAKVNELDDYTSPLIAALENEAYAMAALLYDYGADPTVKDDYGDTALDYFEVDTVEEFEAVLNELK